MFLPTSYVVLDKKFVPSSVFGIITKTTDGSQTTTDESQKTTDESQTTTDESFLKFFEYIYKTLFSERIWFSKYSYEKVAFT